MKSAQTRLLAAFIGVACIAVSMPSRSSGGTDQGDAKTTEAPRVSCTLDPSALNDRMGLVAQLSTGVIERRELDDGFAWGFPAEDKWLSAITEVVTLERKCCDFLTFRIVVEPEGKPIWLELAGPEGTKELLRTQLGF